MGARNQGEDALIKKIVEVFRANGRMCVFFLAFCALTIGLMAVLLAATLNLDACHLCIFQRLIFFLIAGVLLVALAGWEQTLVRNTSLAVGSVLSVWGMVVSAQQSWLQWYPQSGFSCNLVEVGFTERLINWLGGVFPAFFMASGACDSKDLVVLGLSLANWSFLILFGFLVACIALLMIQEKGRPICPGDFD